MLLAEWSGKTAIKNQKHIQAAFEVGKPDLISIEILKLKIGGWGKKSNFWHVCFSDGTNDWKLQDGGREALK